MSREGKGVFQNLAEKMGKAAKIAVGVGMLSGEMRANAVPLSERPVVRETLARGNDLVPAGSRLEREAEGKGPRYGFTPGQQGPKHRQGFRLGPPKEGVIDVESAKCDRLGQPGKIEKLENKGEDYIVWVRSRPTGVIYESKEKAWEKDRKMIPTKNQPLRKPGKLIPAYVTSAIFEKLKLGDEIRFSIVRDDESNPVINNMCRQVFPVQSVPGEVVVAPEVLVLAPKVELPAVSKISLPKRSGPTIPPLRTMVDKPVRVPPPHRRNY